MRHGRCEACDRPSGPGERVLIGEFPVFLEVCALIGALCAGFILAQAPGQRSNQLVACLVLGASWWALANANVDAAEDAATALAWLRLGAPGWAFIAALLPHLSVRYFDGYPRDELVRLRRMTARAAGIGYAAGVIVMLGVIFLPDTVFREVHRVPWGWNHVPGPLQLAFLATTGPCAMMVFPMAYKGFRMSVAVAPLVQRISLYVAMSIPALAIGVTESTLPIARVDFPRLGAASYSLFGLIFLVAVLRYGVTFLTPNRFSHEMLDTLGEGVAMLTPAGRLRHVNRSLARMTGVDADELIGRRVDAFLACDAPLSDGLIAAPGGLSTRDGTCVPVEVSTAVLRDQQGNDMGLVVGLRDMREIRALHQHILTQARLAAVGELAAGVAHEINNPLAFVRANLGVIEGYLQKVAPRSADGASDPTGRDELQREAMEAVQESLEGVDRVTRVVRGVRRFTDSGRLERKPADLNLLIEDAIEMARLDRSGRARIDFAPGEPLEVPCAEQDVRQVFLNLLVNGVEATAPSGTVRVATFAEDGHAVAEISDEGCGMTSDEAARVFDPFYTTKTSGDGAGLGLTIAWHIVQAHGGMIDVDSSPGDGTTFRVRLPLETAAPPTR